VNQFSIITELLGTPPDDVIQTIASENTLRFVQSLPKREKIPFAQKLRTADADALDLLDLMLVFDPRTRITATESLAHAYVAPYHDPTDEPEAGEKFDWSFNDADLPVDTWKVMMYSEILGQSCCVRKSLPYAQWSSQTSIRSVTLARCTHPKARSRAKASLIRPEVPVLVPCGR
jgi:serine/threonine protein kinase